MPAVHIRQLLTNAVLFRTLHGAIMGKEKSFEELPFSSFGHGLLTFLEARIYHDFYRLGTNLSILFLTF